MQIAQLPLYGAAAALRTQFLLPGGDPYATATSMDIGRASGAGASSGGANDGEEGEEAGSELPRPTSLHSFMPGLDFYMKAGEEAEAESGSGLPHRTSLHSFMPGIDGDE